jgi:glycerol-3-phosphate O-acyltransferase
MVFVAGHRVTTDPLAVPFSRGRNLLSIYSKKYVDADPEKKQERLLHNQRTIKRMGQLLSEGGYCIYVAPSGGRDRKDQKTGKVEAAAFDPQSIEFG